MVFTLPEASRIGAGRCPALICARSSDWICESSMVEPLSAADGMIVNWPSNVPWPMIWPVPPEIGVLYSLSMSMKPLFVISLKKLAMLGVVVAVTPGA